MTVAVFHSFIRHVFYRGPPRDQVLPLENFLSKGCQEGCERGKCILTILSSQGGYCADEKTTVGLFSGAGWRGCEQRGSGGSWKHKHEPQLNKDACFPQCSKPIDHKSICVLYFSRLACVDGDYLLWIPSLFTTPSFSHLQKHMNLFPKTNQEQVSSSFLVCLLKVAEISERYVCLFPLQWRVNSAQCNKKWITHSLGRLCHSSLSWTNNKLIPSRLISFCSPQNIPWHRITDRSSLNFLLNSLKIRKEMRLLCQRMTESKSKVLIL